MARLEARGEADAQAALTTLYCIEQRSIGGIAALLGVGHRSVRQLMNEFGIPKRSIAEQKAIDLGKMSYADRLAMTAASRSIIRGRPRSHDELCRRAQTKQERAVLSGDEAEIMAAFAAAGLHPIPLYAVDKYNIDFAFPEQELAIEYHGGNWHNTPTHQAGDERKAAFLRNQGWRLLVFPRLDKPQPNNAGNRRIAIDEIVRQAAGALVTLAQRSR
jgi:very-short-patch-repair endonuclease